MSLKLCLLLLLFRATIGTTPSSFDSIDEGYQIWARRMGSSYGLGSGSSFYGSLIKKAKNRLKPCLRLVSKKPRSIAFASVGVALRSVPIVNNCWVVISISAGTYQKVEIPATMAYVTAKEAGADKTVIEWDDTADRIGPDGRPLGTFASATFANKAPLLASGALGKQAVALRMSVDAEASVECCFIGSQDTLYDHVGRHYFRDCNIEGSVDFAFGNALSFYRGCRLHGASSSYRAVMAQKRESLLDRAWGTFSRVVFAHAYMDRNVTTKGWFDWGDKNRDMTVFYGRYKSMGPGASSGGRVPWSRELTPEEAMPFVSLDFIGAQAP
ncbi:hypothetical protein BT93_L1944 [Corymbia citriodora subsp. variegata]|uniref:pectinesterase n=1 Tax=Corymbia citriodora subsp. variegata TaxID=360336 RepID=A0A8T0CL76_CORYI|nr:hypothetical protein BT93_L1944 [Corymbia citriodora subsp. variegata]